LVPELIQRRPEALFVASCCRRTSSSAVNATAPHSINAAHSTPQHRALCDVLRRVGGASTAENCRGFNWLNHPNWGGVDGNPRSATRGKVTSKTSERNLQISLRYSF